MESSAPLTRMESSTSHHSVPTRCKHKIFESPSESCTGLDVRLVSRKWNLTANHVAATQVSESVGILMESDEVEMSVTMNRRSGARKARSISLLARSADRRELGKVGMQ